MIEYVVGHNPDDRTIFKACEILKSGGIIALPIDTNWVSLADPFNQNALKKIYNLRQLDEHKHLSLLCPNFQKASELAIIDDGAYALIKKVIPGPYTFIFNASKKVQKSLKASKSDHEVGIRFPQSVLLEKILKKYDTPLISTHITIDMFKDAGEIETVYPALIEDEFSTLIDFIIDPGEYEFSGPSSIINFCNGFPEIIRNGAGDTKIFETK